MGKGRIVGGGTSGEYQVELVFSRDRITKRIAAFNQQLSIISEQISKLESEILSLETDIALLRFEILALEVDKVKNADTIKQKNNQISAKIEEKYQKNNRRSALDLIRTGTQKKIDYLNANMPADETISAWCADLTENLTGEVGTIEIPGERGDVLIQPGYNNNALYNGSRDGILEPAIAGTPAGTFWNWALLPGWQKWKPTYRTGYITAKDGEYCDLTLDATPSSARGLDINAYDTFSNVPIIYMSCDEAAFSVGDHVVVQFDGQSWDNPTVIGFVDNPKGCGGFRFKLTRSDGVAITQSLGAYFAIVNSSGDNVACLAEYESATGYWSVGFADIGDADDEKGYWVEYGCTDAVRVQYPSQYRSAFFRQEAHLVKPGTYEDTLPKWKLTYSENREDNGYLETPLIRTVTVETPLSYTVTCNYRYPQNNTVHGYGNFTIPPASPVWQTDIAYSGDSIEPLTFVINAVHTGGTDQCTLEGDLASEDFTNMPDAGHGVLNVAIGVGDGSYSVSLSDSCIWGSETITLHRTVSYVYETMEVPLTITPTSHHLTWYLGASYEI